MASPKSDDLRAQSHKLGKTIAAVRFSIKHAGTGRGGAPSKPLTKERKKEMEERIKTFEAERAELRKQLKGENSDAPKPKLAKSKLSKEGGLIEGHASVEKTEAEVTGER